MGTSDTAEPSLSRRVRWEAADSSIWGLGIMPPKRRKWCSVTQRLSKRMSSAASICSIQWE